MVINLSQLPTDQAAFLAKFAAYVQARNAHKLTIDVPAPFPEFEVFRVAYERGETIVIHDDTPPAPPPAPVPTAAQIAAANLAEKKLLAIRALEEQRLAVAVLDPQAPQAVKDYAALLKG